MAYSTVDRGMITGGNIADDRSDKIGALQEWINIEADQGFETMTKYELLRGFGFHKMPDEGDYFLIGDLKLAGISKQKCKQGEILEDDLLSGSTAAAIHNDHCAGCLKDLSTRTVVHLAIDCDIKNETYLICTKCTAKALKQRELFIKHKENEEK